MQLVPLWGFWPSCGSPFSIEHRQIGAGDLQKGIGDLQSAVSLAHRNRCDLRLRCPSRTPEIARFPRQEKAMLHCDLRVRWKVAIDLRFRTAISEPQTYSFCGISGDLAPSARKSLAIAIVRFWCAKQKIFPRLSHLEAEIVWGAHTRKEGNPKRWVLCQILRCVGARNSNHDLLAIRIASKSNR